MAYVTPPTFTTGNILTATNLNTLSDDIEFLYGLANGVNLGFDIGVFTVTAEKTWYIQHKHRYLHYIYTVGSDPCNEIQVYYDATLVNETLSTAEGSFSGYIDLNSFGFTVNQWYAVKWDYTRDANSNCVVYYLMESPDTTL